MFLWLIERDETKGPTYDVYNAFVISANSEDRAREIASHHAADEGATAWFDPSTKCNMIGTALGSLEHICLSSFNAG